MTREIKFRAWDKKKKIMYPRFFTFNPRDEYFADFVGEDAILSMSYPNSIMTEFEIMQYTGLKDKNGKEIYEGDIVDYIIDHKLKNGGVRSWRQIGKGYPKIVAWKNLKLAWNLKNSSHYRVIGNIYENPNLIKTS